MTYDLGTAVIGFAANTSGLSAGMGEVQRLLGGIPAPVAIAAAAVVGLGVTAAKMAGDYEEATTTLVTGAGEQAKNLNMVRQGMLDMAVQTGTSTKQLVAGMFMIESAGFHGAAGLNVLKTAAEGSRVGNADLGVVAKALTGILINYHMPASEAANAMNALTATVSSGQMHLQDLASSMGSVMPLASALGISFPQVAGAIAEMTNHTMSAQRASMNLANAIRSLEAPGSAAQKAMASVGIDAQGLKDTLAGPNGLADAIQFIQHMIGEKFPAGSIQAVEAFKKIMGGATGYNVALMLGGKNMADYQNNIVNITKAMQSGHGAVTGWSDVQKDFNFKMSQAKEVLETFMIRLGTAFLPILGKVADFFVSTLVPALATFGGWIQQNVMPILQKFGDWFQKTAMPVLQQFGAAILSYVVPAVQNIVSIIGGALSWIQQHWTQIWGILGPIVTGVFNVIVGFFKIVWSEISGIFKVAMDILSGNWGKAWTDIKDMLAGVWNGIKDMVGGGLQAVWGIIKAAGGLLLDALKWPFEQVASWVGGLFSNLGSTIHNALANMPLVGGALHDLHIPGFAMGGTTPGGPILVGEHGPEILSPPGGYGVTPLTNSLGSSAGLGMAGGGTHTTQLYLDGQMIAQLVAPHMDAMVRAKFGPRARS